MKNKNARRVLTLGLTTVLAATTAMPVSAAFDASYYASKYTDVAKVMGTSPAALESHYNTYGVKEGRFGSAADEAKKSSLRTLFNAEYYAALYPDVVAVYGTDPEALYSHFITFGIKEGRAINP